MAGGLAEAVREQGSGIESGQGHGKGRDLSLERSFDAQAVVLPSQVGGEAGSFHL